MCSASNPVSPQLHASPRSANSSALKPAQCICGPVPSVTPPQPWPLWQPGPAEMTLIAPPSKSMPIPPVIEALALLTSPPLSRSRSATLGCFLATHTPAMLPSPSRILAQSSFPISVRPLARTRPSARVCPLYALSTAAPQSDTRSTDNTDPLETFLSASPRLSCDWWPQLPVGPL